MGNNKEIKYKEYKFEGKYAIITGAGSGVGRSTAIELAKGGAKLALVGRRKELIESTKEECLEFTDTVIAVSMDVGDEKSVKTGMEKILEVFERVDILVNCAGFENRLKPGETFWKDHFDNMTSEEYMKYYYTHALGHYLMSTSVLPLMIKNRFGRVVNITSVLGITGTYEGPAYSGSKAAAIVQTRAFAKRYGEYNITFNSIAPGMVDTPMKIDCGPEERQWVLDVTPMGRIAEAIDIARVVLFFAQEDLFVSGQTLVVDGASN